MAAVLLSCVRRPPARPVFATRSSRKTRSKCGRLGTGTALAWRGCPLDWTRRLIAGRDREALSRRPCALQSASTTRPEAKTLKRCSASAVRVPRKGSELRRNDNASQSGSEVHGATDRMVCIGVAPLNWSNVVSRHLVEHRLLALSCERASLPCFGDELHQRPAFAPRESTARRGEHTRMSALLLGRGVNQK